MANENKDNCFAWGLLVALIFIYVVNGGFLLSIGVYFAVFLEEFQESAATTAWLSSLNYGSTYLIGNVVNRHQEYWVVSFKHFIFENHITIVRCLDNL